MIVIVVIIALLLPVPVQAVEPTPTPYAGFETFNPRGTPVAVPEAGHLSGGGEGAWYQYQICTWCDGGSRALASDGPQNGIYVVVTNTAFYTDSVVALSECSPDCDYEGGYNWAGSFWLYFAAWDDWHTGGQTVTWYLVTPTPEVTPYPEPTPITSTVTVTSPMFIQAPATPDNTMFGGSGLDGVMPQFDVDSFDDAGGWLWWARQTINLVNRGNLLFVVGAILLAGLVLGWAIDRVKNPR